MSDEVVELIKKAVLEEELVEINDNSTGEVMCVILPIKRWTEIKDHMARLEKLAVSNLTEGVDFTMLVGVLKEHGQEDLANEIEALAASMQEGDIDPQDLGVRMNALMAKAMEWMPGVFVPTLATDPDEELKDLTGG